MRIQLASDLHLEHLQRAFPGERLITPADGADALVLAGDIANGTQAIQLFKSWPVPVLYLGGNHEFYHHELQQTRLDLKSAAAGTAVHFLDNCAIKLAGTRFLGATLWTDYRLFPQWSQQQLMQAAQNALKDHQAISYNARPFTAAAALAEHMQSRAWLQRELNKPYAGKTVVITHHAPHPLSIHSRHSKDPITAAFVSNLGTLVAQADFWFHGHVHDSFDYHVGKCRVVANPRGYAYDKHAANKARDLVFENPAFQWTCVIDITPIED
ncbi:MAG TPA: metallophosphoesterase [Eoetvoesiella sp.]